MKSILLLSLVLATYIVPTIVSRDPNPIRGLRRLVQFFVVFTVVYVMYVAFGHTVLFVPHR